MVIPSSENPDSRNEAKCKNFLVIMSFVCMRMKNHFHINGFTLNLALKQLEQVGNGLVYFGFINSTAN